MGCSAGFELRIEQMGHIVGPDRTGGVRVAAVLDFSDSHEVDLLSKARLVPRCLNPGLSFE